MKEETFYRLLGGTVEPGEPEDEALGRELREELGAEVEVGSRLAEIDNVFTYEGEQWHDLCLVYECTLQEEDLYARDHWNAEESTPSGLVLHRVSWKHVEKFGPGGAILYPEGLLELL